MTIPYIIGAIVILKVLFNDATEEEKAISAQKRGAGKVIKAIYFSSLSHKKCVSKLLEKHKSNDNNIYINLKADIILDGDNYKFNNIKYIYSKESVVSNKIKKCEENGKIKLNEELEEKWHYIESRHKKYMDIQRKYGANNYNAEGTIYPEVNITVKNSEGKILKSFPE